MALVLGCLLPARAQTTELQYPALLSHGAIHVPQWDSMLYVIHRTETGVAGWDIEDAFPTRLLDATGDGQAELITLDKDDSGVPETMHVIDVKTQTEVMTIDLARIRSFVLSNGTHTPQFTMRFRGFINWIAGDPQLPSVALFIAEGAPIVYDPTNQNILSLSPDQWRVMGITDLDGDGWLDLILGDKENRLIEVHISRFSPGFND